MKRFVTILVLLGLLIIPIGSECLAYGPFYCPLCKTDYQVEGEHGDDKCSKKKIGCGWCSAVYEKGTKHSCSGSEAVKSGKQVFYSGGEIYSYCSKCNTRYQAHINHTCPVATTTASTTTKLPYTTTGEKLPPSASIQKDDSCKSSFVLLNAPVQVNIRRAPYWPSRRRMIYFNNVYSGRQIRYLGSNWGWRGSRSRRSGGFWGTGYYGYVR